MKTAKRIAKNTISLFTSGLISPMIAVAAVVYLARVLGPGDFGAINFAIALIAYFTLFTDLGLGLYGTREVARDKDQIRRYLGSVLALRIILSAISFIILLIFVALINKAPEIKLLILIFGLGLIPSAFLVEWAYQGMEKMEFIGLSRILTRLVFMLLVVGFVKRHDQLFLVPCFQVGSVIAVNLIFFVIFVRKFGLPKININFGVWKNMLRSALPLGVSIILVQVIYNMSTVILGFIKGEEAVGYYNAAYKVIFPIVMGAAAYFDAIFPVLSNYFKTSIENLIRIQRYTARLTVTFVFPLAVGGVILARPIIGLFFGDEYAPSVVAFQVLIWSASIICLNMIYARGLWACNKQGVYLKIVIGQAIVNIICNLILIPRYGLHGATISTVIGELAGFYFYYHEFNKVVKIPIIGFIWKPLLATAILALFLLAIPQNVNVIIIIIAGIVVYTLSLFFMRGITRDDIATVRKVLA